MILATLPGTVDGLSPEAFAYCPNLKGVLFQGNAPSTVDPEVFYASPAATVYYYWGTTGWNDTLSGAPVVKVTIPVIVQGRPIKRSRWAAGSR